MYNYIQNIAIVNRLEPFAGLGNNGLPLPETRPCLDKRDRPSATCIFRVD
jgi:hypothetical protein